MRNIGLLANPGGYDGTSGELSDDEKKRLRAMAALQMGASMLANNQGNYGAFAPVLGVGLQNGLASYQMNKAVMQKDAEQRRLAEASRNAFQNAFTPPTQASYNIGQSQTATPEDAAIQSGNAPGTFGLFADMGVAPNITAAMDGKPMPKSQFNLQDYTMPKQDVVYTPASDGQLDFAKYGKNLIESGYPALYEKGIDIALATQPKAVDPKLETVYDKDGVARQVWLKPGQTLEQGVQAGYGKPDDVKPLPREDVYTGNGQWQMMEYNPKSRSFDKPIGQPFSKRPTASETSTNVIGPKIDIKTGESLASQIGPMAKDSKIATQGAVKMFDSANRVIKALDSGKVIAGPFASTRQFINQLGYTMGFTGPESVQQTRQVIRALAESSVEARKELQGQGQVTENEAKAVEKAMSGNIDDLTAPELRDIANLNKKAARYRAAAHEDLLKAMDTEGTKGLSKYYKVKGADALLDENHAIDALVNKYRGK